MRLILAFMWAVVLFGFWTAQEGWSADERPAPPKNWPWTVEGLGFDVGRAKESALEKAREEIIVRLRACKPPINAWQPSTDFIQNTLVESAEEGKDLHLDVGVAKRWVLHLRPPKWELFFRLDREEREILRHQRGEERMLLLGKVLGGFMVMLIAGIVYVRVDDWTQRYYTRWLQLAGASLIVAIGTGLWLLS